MARVSNPKNQDNPKIAGLVRYLIDHNHWSPFELVNMCVEIETSRAISAQILRHRSFSFQEFSQRYAAVQEFEPVAMRLQAESNRQSSLLPGAKDGRIEDWGNMISLVQGVAIKTYQNALDIGIAKEVARFLLPMSAKTRMYMNGSVRSWIHYINLRTQEDTQKEHRDIANAIKEIFVRELPVTAEALGWNNPE